MPENNLKAMRRATLAFLLLAVLCLAFGIPATIHLVRGTSSGWALVGPVLLLAAVWIPAANYLDWRDFKRRRKDAERKLERRR